MNHRGDAFEMLCGVNPVLEALRSGRVVTKVYVSSQKSRSAREMIALAEARRVPVTVVEEDFFEERFAKGHQGVAAFVARKRHLTPEDLLSVPEERGEAPFFFILDGLEDPRNFGAILRVADAAGIHGVVVQERRAAGVGPSVAKASAGAVEYVNIAEAVNVKHAIRLFKERDITIVGAEAAASVSLWASDLTLPLAIVVGSEGRGLRRTVRDLCDTTVSLPMRGHVTSLNVSVAAAIFAYEVLRQRELRGRGLPNLVK
jgi:23S rRNA (guanosine2251-2'-O)-methyltransferase